MNSSPLASAPDELQALLSLPEITDVCINGTEEVFFDRGQGMEPAAEKLPWHESQLREWALSCLSACGKTWDARHPFMDATLESAHASFRLHFAFPPLTRQGLVISIRRLASGAAPSSRGDARWRDSPLYPLLESAVRRGDSVLISGATGSGKTTLASDLLAAVPGHERIIALEDTPELDPAHPHFLSLTSRPPNADGFGEVTLRTLLKQVLRMRPDRIILGECRGAEVLELLQALNTGHRGSLATLHANSPRDALRRAELLCLLSAGGTIPIQAIRELLSVGVQWIAQVEKNARSRRISEVWKVEGREGDTILLRPMVKSPDEPLAL